MTVSEDFRPEGLSDAERHAQGMRVRRAVLSDAHVDRAIAATVGLTADWQDFITRVAWGDIWSRPGLDRRSRSVAVLSSLIAHGHHEELAMHLRAALRNGLTVEVALHPLDPHTPVQVASVLVPVSAAGNEAAILLAPPSAAPATLGVLVISPTTTRGETPPPSGATNPASA